MAVLSESGKQADECFAIFGPGLGGLQRRDIFADGHDHHVRFERQFILHSCGDVVGGMSTLEVGDVLGQNLGFPSCRFSDASGKDVDIVLVLRAGGHAPVAGPANLGLWAVKGDAVAEEKNFADAEVLQLQFFTVGRRGGVDRAC